MLIIDDIIKDKGMTLQEVADKLGVARNTLYRQMNGNPTVETVQKIADVLGVHISELFRGSYSPDNDFVAMISHEGKLMRFNSIEQLTQFINSLNPET